MTRGEPLISFPRRLSVETVGTCNARCTFCPHPKLDKNARNERMKDDIFAAVLDQSRGKHELETVTLSFQNEPLMDPLLPERIAAVRRHLPTAKVSIVTNASLLRGRRLAALQNSPPDLIKLSVSSIDPEEYERSMVGLRFHRTMQNIEAVRDWSESCGGKPELTVNCVYPLRGTKRSLREISDFWREKRIKLHVINLENRGGFFKADDMSDLTESKLYTRNWCKRPEEQLSVWPDGHVALCCADWTREVTLGNVLDQSLQEMWYGATIGSYREALRSGCGGDVSPCATCDQAQIDFEGKTFVDAKDLAERIAKK